MTLYYIEVNVICMILLVIVRFQLKNISITTVRERYFFGIIWATVLFCLSDMCAGILRGAMFPGSRTFIEISNLIYYEALVIISYLWYMYVETRIYPNRIVPTKKLLILSIPGLLFTLLALTNPFTNIVFSINEQNLYVRNIGIYLHWIVVWTYFLVPFVKVHRLYVQEISIPKKKEIQPLLMFVIAPIIASILQMIFYGVTTTQVGITISILLICFKAQEAHILTDTLTGINNRRSLETFVDNQLQHNHDAQYTVIMIDIDHFKQINDKHGHMRGDIVLRKVAEGLRKAIQYLHKPIHLSRYGGDEFLYVIMDCEEKDVQEFILHVREEVKTALVSTTLSFPITISVGYAQGSCTSTGDFNQLLVQADEDMYDEKASK